MKPRANGMDFIANGIMAMNVFEPEDAIPMLIWTAINDAISDDATASARQKAAVVGLILGIILGTLFYKPFADFLRETMNMPDRPASIMAFFIILLVVPLICGVLGNLLSKLIHIASLGFIDRLLGAAFGLLKYLLIMGLIIMLLDMTGYSDKIINRTERRQSKMYTRTPAC